VFGFHGAAKFIAAAPQSTSCSGSILHCRCPTPVREDVRNGWTIGISLASRVVALVIAVLAAVVGSVGLMSAMFINVVERSREIGVMRSIGGTSAAILGIFLTVGVLVGVLSWPIAVPLSYPGACALSNMVGQSFNLPRDFDYSVQGGVAWFVIVVVLSALASLWPALRATQVSVREALSYE